LDGLDVLGALDGACDGDLDGKCVGGRVLPQYKFPDTPTK